MFFCVGLKARLNLSKTLSHLPLIVPVPTTLRQACIIRLKINYIVVTKILHSVILLYFEDF